MAFVTKYLDGCPMDNGKSKCPLPLPPLKWGHKNKTISDHKEKDLFYFVQIPLYLRKYLNRQQIKGFSKLKWKSSHVMELLI